MTFCLTMKLRDGLVGIADTRLTAGNQTLMAKKLFMKSDDKKYALFLMTSGLRALRDKAVTYFEESLEENGGFHFNKMYKLVNVFGEIIRKVAQEDKPSLSEAGYEFNLHALIAGQLEEDSEHKLFMLFPEGNWVEVGMGNPYFIIGNTNHGKPILDRVLKFDSTIDFALKVGFLSFNATRVSANDVAYPIDVVVYRRDAYYLESTRFDRDQLQPYADWWQGRLVHAINEFPHDWDGNILAKIQKA